MLRRHPAGAGEVIRADIVGRFDDIALNDGGRQPNDPVDFTLIGRRAALGPSVEWHVVKRGHSKERVHSERYLPRTSCPPPRFRPTECRPETVDRISTLRVPEPRSTKSALITCHSALGQCAWCGCRLGDVSGSCPFRAAAEGDLETEAGERLEVKAMKNERSRHPPVATPCLPEKTH